MMEVEQFFGEKEAQVFGQFLANQQTHEQNWKQKTQDYWIKFVINVREILFSFFKFHAEPSDYVYVDTLKLLIGKKFDGVYNYINHVYKVRSYEMGLYDLEETLNFQTEPNRSQIAETYEYLFGDQYLDLTPYWLTSVYRIHFNLCKGIILALQSSADHQIEFTVPSRWKYEMLYYKLWSFEVFLRSRWGGELFKILGCTKKDIGWWRAPLQDVRQRAPAARHPIRGRCPCCGCRRAGSAPAVCSDQTRRR